MVTRLPSARNSIHKLLRVRRGTPSRTGTPCASARAIRGVLRGTLRGIWRPTPVTLEIPVERISHLPPIRGWILARANKARSGYLRVISSRSRRSSSLSWGDLQSCRVRGWDRALDRPRSSTSRRSTPLSSHRRRVSGWGPVDPTGSRIWRATSTASSGGHGSSPATPSSGRRSSNTSRSPGSLRHLFSFQNVKSVLRFSLLRLLRLQHGPLPDVLP